MAPTDTQAIASKHICSRIGLTGRIALVAPLAAEIKSTQSCTQEEAEREACGLLGIVYESAHGNQWKTSEFGSKYTA